MACKYYDKYTGSCIGTKNKESCNCNGFESKCDFYPEKRNKKILITNRQWLNSLSDEKLALWLLNEYCTNTNVDGYDLPVQIGVGYLDFWKLDNPYDGLVTWLTGPVSDKLVD